MSYQDVPKYVRYDFFVAILGLVMFYFAFSNEKIYLDTFSHWTLTLVGITCLIFGLYHMKENYLREREVDMLTMQLTKREILTKLEPSIRNRKP